MRQPNTILRRILSLGAAMLLFTAMAMPALWTMKCFTMDRVVHMWGYAEDCMPPEPQTEEQAMKPLCCAFTGVQVHLDPGTVQAAPSLDGSFVLPAHFPVAFTTIVEPQTAIAAVAHGPPRALSSYDLRSIGRLRI